MTRDQNIKNIRDACIKVNESIKDLDFGCLIMWKNTGSTVRITHSHSGRFWNEYGQDYSLSEDNFEIIGREPNLQDVLMAIPTTKSISVSPLGFFEEWTLVKDEDYRLRHITRWSLPHGLYGQSDECLEILAKLLA